MRFFDVQVKDVKVKFESIQLEEKKKGLEDLCNVYGNTKTYKEQLQLFATKTQPLMRVLTGDISNFKKNKGSPVFKELTKDISEFLLNLICELRFKIKMDDDPFS